MEKVVFCLLLAVFAIAYAQEENTVRVALQNGEIVGDVQQFVESRFRNVDRQMNVFKGLPYAEPPMRFRPPQEKLPWTEAYNATFYRYACPQANVPLDALSEDCLTLNVFAPAGASNLPVMVYFHSGDFSSGSVNFALFDGTALAALNDVIVVTVNYRLGALGFATSDSDLIPGNMGLMDQAMSLRWVRENIAAFGGDNEQVTIFGDGAGSASVSLHMVSPTGREFFDRAILQSASFYSYWAFEGNRSIVAGNAFEMAIRAGCPNTENDMDILQCMLRVDLATMLIIQQQFVLEGRRFVPVVDGTYIPELPSVMVDRGDVKKCPTIGGINKDAGNRDILYVKPANFDSVAPPRLNDTDFFTLFYVSNTFTFFEDQKIIETLSQAIYQEYIDYSKYFREDFDYFQAGSEVHGDIGWTCPLLNFTFPLTLLSENPSWIYELSFVPARSIYSLYGISEARWLGATLEEELQLVFGMGFGPLAQSGFFNPSDEEKELSIQVMKYWTNFAKTGNPNLPDLNSLSADLYQEWTPYTQGYQWYLNITENVELSDGLKSQRCGFWNLYIPSLRYLLQEYVSKSYEVEATSNEWAEQFEEWQESHEAWKESFAKYQEDRCD